NLAKRQPDKLRSLIALWNEEAERNQVLPLRSSLDHRFNALIGRPSVLRDSWLFWGPDISLPWKEQPVLSGRDFSLVAELELDKNDSGVVLATGSYLGGRVFYLDRSREVVEHARSHKPQDRFRIAAK